MCVCVCVSLTGKCFLYCNGLMDHIYVCRNGSSCTSLYRTQTHFSGTLVSGNFGAKWLLLQIGVTAELNTSSSEFLLNKPEHQHGKMYGCLSGLVCTAAQAYQSIMEA